MDKKKLLKSVVLGKFSWWRVVRLPFIIYGVLLVIGGLFPYSFIFPYRDSSYGAELRNLELLASANGDEIAVVYHKAPQERYVALYFHGNAEDIGHSFGNVYELLFSGISVLAMDYPGYGLSTGKPTETTCHLAAQELYRYAIEDLGYTPEQVLLWGRSVGGGVAMNLAQDAPAKALVLESPFATAFTVATRVPLVPFDKFDNLSKMEELGLPLFILHGDNDRVIAPVHSSKLYERCHGRKARYLIPTAGHNDLWSHVTKEHMQALLEFLEQ